MADAVPGETVADLMRTRPILQPVQAAVPV
jgi:hypothetical protein